MFRRQMSSLTQPQQWIIRQRNDPFVKQAVKEGYRSRAAFKLVQIQEKYNILKPGHIVLDLGAAPGGWSQVATSWVHKNKQGMVISIDKTVFEPLLNAHVFVGDIHDPRTWAAVNHLLHQQKGQGLSDKIVDVVLSDMAPAATGNKLRDVTSTVELCQKALHIAETSLSPNGTLVCKFFQGEGTSDLKKRLQDVFAKVIHFKPQASRSGSSEGYFIAMGKR